MDHVLDNPAWSALISNHQHFAQGNSKVKYYAKEVSPFIGMVENTVENFQVLYDTLPHDGPVGFISPLQIAIPSQWQVLNSINCYQMIYNGKAKPEESGAELLHLTEAHIPQMLALTKLTNPGPFNSRTIDFGHYYGIFDGADLVAMAGQRMHINEYAEISAVCTHPNHLSKGYAKQLLNFQINRMVAAGDVPILHVRLDNYRAIDVYERVGFKKRQQICFTIMTRAGAAV